VNYLKPQARSRVLLFNFGLERIKYGHQVATQTSHWIVVCYSIRVQVVEIEKLMKGCYFMQFVKVLERTNEIFFLVFINTLQMFYALNVFLLLVN